jgi:hypothetical protein
MISAELLWFCTGEESPPPGDGWLWFLSDRVVQTFRNDGRRLSLLDIATNQFFHGGEFFDGLLLAVAQFGAVDVLWLVAQFGGIWVHTN